MEIFARRFLSVTPALYAVIAGGDAAVLNLHIGCRVRKLAISVGSGALVSLVFPAHLQLQPSGIFAVQQIVHVYYGHRGFLNFGFVLGTKKNLFDYLDRGRLVYCIRWV